jgi:PAS domain S-box-containing protein/putative nucleotidyltransferase with HDIG domain
MQESGNSSLLSISQAARLLGVHVGTLRRWDSLGLLSAVRRRPNGPRLYPPEAIAAYRNTHPQSTTLIERVTYAALLEEISRAVSASLDLPAIYRAVYDGLRAAMAVDAFFLAFYDGPANTLDVQLLIDGGEERSAGPNLAVEAALAEVRATRRALCIQRPVIGPYGQVHDRIASWIVVPVFQGAEVPAVFSIQSTEPDAYTPAQVELLEQVAARVAPAMHNARLYARAREEEVRYRALLEQAADAVFVTDERGRYVEINEAAATLFGYSRDELRARTADALRNGFMQSPEGEGILEGLAAGPVRVEMQKLRKDGSALPIELRMTRVRVGGQVLLQAICRDLTPRIALEAVREREHQLYLASVRSLAATVDARDAYTHSHSQQVAFYCRLIARELGLPDEQVETIELAGLLHDIGKIAVPDYILQKPGRLTADEWAIMRAHSAKGADILSAGNSAALAPIVPMVRSHHERWAGGGYPDGLAGDAIPLGAAVIALADAFDTITTPRPYKPASTLHEACVEIRRSSGRHFKPDIADAFLRVIERDRAAGAEYLEAIARMAEPSTSAVPRLAALPAPPPRPLGPESLTYQEQQRLAAHMQSLYEISRGFPHVDDEAELVAAAARLAQDHFGAESVYLLEIDGPAATPAGCATPPGPRVVARWGWHATGDFEPWATTDAAVYPLMRELMTADQPVAIADIPNLLSPPRPTLAYLYGWRSGIFIPLWAGGKTLGALGLAYHSSYHHFSADDLELADTLGAAAARAFAGLQLRAAEQQLRHQIRELERSNQALARRSRDLAVLYETARSLIEILDVDALCRRIVEVLGATFSHSLISVALIEGTHLHFRAWYGYEGIRGIPAIPITDGVVGRVVRTGQPALVPDVRRDPDYIGVHPALRSEICVPLTGRDGVLGVVNIESDSPDPLADDDLHLLLTLTPQIVIALENARLYTAAQQQATQLGLINRVAHAMAGLLAGDSATLLDHMACLFQRELGYANVAIFLIDPVTRELVCQASAGEYIACVPVGYRQPAGVGLIGWVADHGTTVVANDVATEPRFHRACAAETPGAELVAPLIHRGRTIGMLDVESCAPHSFSPGDVQMLETLADQLAVAIEHAHLAQTVHSARHP